MLYKLKKIFPLAALAFFVALPAVAQEADEVDKAWREIELQLPAAPQNQDLLPFYASPTATQKFSIDAKSLSVGKDGVVRYTLVSVGNGGATNVSYEGIHCDRMQKRLYAFGRPDGSWSRSRREEWEPIRVTSPNRQHVTLATDLICTDRIIAGTAEQITRNIRLNGKLGEHRTGYGAQ